MPLRMFCQDFKVILLFLWPIWPMIKENICKNIEKLGKVISLKI